MSNFEVRVFPIDAVEDHPNADRLSICRIKGFLTISAKLSDGSHRYEAGDLVLYVPEGAVVPESILKTHGFWKEGKGTLAGSRGDRVKAIKLRGVVSQGLMLTVNRPVGQYGYTYISEPDPDTCDIIPLSDDLDELLEKDHSETLHIHKYEPPIPASMSGDVLNLGSHRTVSYDIENAQRHPGVFREGEIVSATEKLHGTFTALCWYPGLGEDGLMDGQFFAYSKGLGAKGLVFRDTEKNRTENIYHRQLREFFTPKRLADIAALAQRGIFPGFNRYTPITFLGETFGRGIQDLAYDQMEPAFRLFDVYVGDRATGRYLDYTEMKVISGILGVETVPILYHGPFREEAIMEVRDGKTLFGGVHVREGVVVRPDVERRTDELGRVILKFINPAYLTRKGGTELQ